MLLTKMYTSMYLTVRELESVPIYSVKIMELNKLFLKVGRLEGSSIEKKIVSFPKTGLNIRCNTIHFCQFRGSGNQTSLPVLGHIHLGQ